MRNKPIDPQAVLEFARTAPHTSKVIALRRTEQAQARPAPPPARKAKDGKAQAKPALDTRKLAEALSRAGARGKRPKLTDMPAEAVLSRGTATPFQPLKPPPNVFPEGVTMAMDSALATWAGGGLYQGAAISGYAFLGYPYLSQLAQVAEYRKIVETIAREMTRKFIRFTSKAPVDDDRESDAEKLAKAKTPAPAKADPGMATDFVDTSKTDTGEEDKKTANPAKEAAKMADDPGEQPEETAEEKRRQQRIAKLDEAFETWQVKARCRELVEMDGFFGRAHLYLDTGETDDAAELKLPIGDGRNDLTQLKFAGKRGFLKRLICVEPMWTYPSVYNSNDPLKPTFYAPESWYVMSKEIHISRLITIVGRPVPDLLKPAYSFGGLAMTQMAQSYVQNWLNTRQAVADLVMDYSKRGVQTDLSGLMGADGIGLVERLNVFNEYANNQGVLLLDKETEEFFQFDTTIAGLDKLQAQSQEQIASVSGIPLVILLGIQPAGLNASSEGELTAFENLVHSYQETLLRDPLTRIMNFAQMSIWGDVDPSIGFIFQPLREMNDKERSEIDKSNAETDAILIGDGIISPEEARHRVASDPNMPYGPMDPADMPDPPEPDPGMMGGDPEDGDGGGGQPGGGSPFGNDAALIELAPDVWALDEENFEESKHPRDDGGKFASAPGGGGAETPSFKSKKEHVAHLLKKGTTAKEILQATGWPSVSVPQQAKSAGMKLEKVTEGGVTKYKGVPMTAEEIAAQKKADKDAAVAKASAGKEAAAPAPTEPAKKVEKSSPEEIQKAKSSYPLGQHILPQVSEADLKEFNDKFAGEKAPKTDAEAEAKIAAFKVLHAKNAENAQKAIAAAKQKAIAQRAAEAAEAAAAAEKNKAVMADLGINEQEAVGFGALVKMMGGKQADVVAAFKKHEDEAKSLGYPITGFQAALIRNYTDGGYSAINDALRKGSWSVAQHVYVKMVNKALMQMPRYTGVVNRGAEIEATEQAKYIVGNVVPEKAFTSTSTGGGSGGNTKYKITAIGERGANIKKLSNYAHENEVLFAAHTFFKVTKVDGKPGGQMTVHMEEMPHYD